MSDRLRAWGGPPQQSQIDSSVVPCAAGGSLMLTPEICLPDLHAMKERFGGKIWGPYSFADAFNPLSGWVANDTLGRRNRAAERRKPKRRVSMALVHGESGGQQSHAACRYCESLALAHKTRPVKNALTVSSAGDSALHRRVRRFRYIPFATTYFSVPQIDVAT